MVFWNTPVQSESGTSIIREAITFFNMSFGNIVSRETLFPDTKPAENLIDDIFLGRSADNFTETV